MRPPLLRSAAIPILLFSLGLLAFSAFFAPDIVNSLSGNRALSQCFKALSAGDMERCSSEWGTPAQKSGLRLLKIQQMWKSEQYHALAEACGENPCSCLEQGAGNRLGSQADFYPRFLAFYSSVAYRLVNGDFPPLTSCREVLFPSRYLAKVSQNYREADSLLSEAIHELAYLVDHGWEDERQRGLHAYVQATRYKSQGDHPAAQAAFLKAVLTLENVPERNTELVISTLSLSYQFLGDLYLEAGDLEAAAHAYQHSIQVSPQSGIRSFSGLGQVWQLQGMPLADIAAGFARLQTQSAEESPLLTSQPARVLMNWQAFEQARMLIESASASIQAAPDILGLRGEICEQEGNYACAVDYYKAALEHSDELQPEAAAGLADDLARVSELLENGQ